MVRTLRGWAGTTQNMVLYLARPRLFDRRCPWTFVIDLIVDRRPACAGLSFVDRQHQLDFSDPRPRFLYPPIDCQRFFAGLVASESPFAGLVASESPFAGVLASIHSAGLLASIHSAGLLGSKSPFTGLVASPVNR